MAVNNSRSMRDELLQGTIDGTYMQLCPNWSTETEPQMNRLNWPTYQRVERLSENDHVRRVPSQDNEIIEVAKSRHLDELTSHPMTSLRPTHVDTGIYRFPWRHGDANETRGR